LRDSLASGVDRDLHGGCGEDHRCRKHADGDGLAEAAGGADKDLLGQVVPTVELQDLLVVPAELPLGLRLPEEPCAGPKEVIVELLLMEGPVPPLVVQHGERIPAPLHALETVHVPKALLLLLVPLPHKPQPAVQLGL